MNRNHMVIFMLGVLLAEAAGCARLSAPDLPPPIPEPESKTIAAEKLIQENRYAEAAAAFRRIQEESPDTEWAPRAKFSIAMIFVSAHNAQRDYARALQEFEEFLAQYPGHNKVDDARSWRQALKTLLEAKKDNERMKKNIEQLKQLDMRQEEKRTRRK